MFTTRLFGMVLAVLSTSLNAAELPFPQPLENVYTGGQPSQNQLHDAAAAGVRTVIDLRQPGENRGYDESASAAALGLRYVTLPIAGASGITADNARALEQALTAARADGPVLLHCASGNRVGALLALIHAQREGGSNEAAIELGRKAGMTSLEATARAALAAPPQP